MCTLNTLLLFHKVGKLTANASIVMTHRGLKMEAVLSRKVAPPRRHETRLRGEVLALWHVYSVRSNT